MARRAEPREIDFTWVRTPDEEAADEREYQDVLTAIRGGHREVVKRPLADLATINHAVLEHIRAIAQRVRGQDGYKSQFVALTKPWHVQLGNDVDGVLDRVWREKQPKAVITVTRPKERPVGDADVDSSRPRVWKATDLESSKPKVWLAKQRIPRSGVTVLVGDEGIGKSLLWVWIVGAVTTGKPLPEFGIPTRDPQHVRLVLTEDDWSTEVRPRLELAGADLNYVTVIAAAKDGSGTPVFPSEDMDLLYEDPVPALVIVDAWLDTVPGSLNVQTPQDARLALHPWKDVAVHTGAAVVLMTHTNRAKGTAREKYGITGELRKKARMALFAQRDDQGRLSVGPEKANGTAIVFPSLFTIEVVQVRPPTDDDDGTVARVKYLSEAKQTAGELADSNADSPEKIWLQEYLADGQTHKNVVQAGFEEGFKRYKIRQAAKELGVIITRVGFPAVSEWSLPS
ncbi:AAA family ATPase [Mycobacterium sp. Dal123C01]|uniref:AAA family ATPase n=1 Tax=Mycobacterium sp. Dal123C01 TaxID=3457577 RepID=UPI00403E84D6